MTAEITNFTVVTLCLSSSKLDKNISLGQRRGPFFLVQRTLILYYMYIYELYVNNSKCVPTSLNKNVIALAL